MATDGMLTKQLGGEVAEGIAKVVEELATLNSDLDQIAAVAWANFFGSEEGKAQAGVWKEKEKAWVFHQIINREGRRHRAQAGDQGLCAEDDTCART